LPQFETRGPEIYSTASRFRGALVKEIAWTGAPHRHAGPRNKSAARVFRTEASGHTLLPQRTPLLDGHLWKLSHYSLLEQQCYSCWRRQPSHSPRVRHIMYGTFARNPVIVGRALSALPAATVVHAHAIGSSQPTAFNAMGTSIKCKQLTQRKLVELDSAIERILMNSHARRGELGAAFPSIIAWVCSSRRG